MIVDFHNLPEASLAEHSEHFIAVGNVVVGHVDVRSLVVIVAVVVGTLQQGLLLLGIRADKVDLHKTTCQSHIHFDSYLV